MPKIRIVEDYETQGVQTEIYCDIKRSLRVPLVNTIFKALAPYPDFLKSYWDSLKPNLITKYFVTSARQIRNVSDSIVDSLFDYVDDYAWLRDQGFTRENMREIRYAVEMFHYVLPKVSLLASHLKLSIDGDSFSPREAVESESSEPDFSTKLQIVRANSAPRDVEYIYLDIIDTSGLPIVSAIYQVFAHWPSYLQHIWYDEVKPVFFTHDFDRESDKLTDTIDDMARQLPYTFRDPLYNISEGDADYIRRTVDLFHKILPKMCIVSSGVRNMLIEGERAARASGEHMERSV